MHTCSEPSVTHPVSLRRISTMSVMLDRVALGTIVILPIAVAISWFLPEGMILGLPNNLGGQMHIENPLQFWQRLAGCVIVLAVLGLELIGLWHVKKCFQSFAEGKFFNSSVIDRLYRFSAWTLGFVIASFVAVPALSVLLTFHNAPGHRQLIVGISSEQIFTLLIAGAVWLIAAVMSHANALAEENAQFV